MVLRIISCVIAPTVSAKDLYKFGYDAAEPVLPPFDTKMDETMNETDDDVKLITGLTFCSDERGITCQGHPVLENSSIHPKIGEGKSGG